MDDAGAFEAMAPPAHLRIGYGAHGASMGPSPLDASRRLGGFCISLEIDALTKFK
jgi:hypothetical protein